MIDKNEIEILRNMLGDGETLTVLQELKSKLENSEFHDEIISQLSSINRIYKRRRAGIITMQQEMLAENTLTYILLEILKKLESFNIIKNNPETKQILKSQIPDFKNISKNNISSFKKPLLQFSIDRNINILILGSEGSGKSTLINCVFGKEVAEVGSDTVTTLSVELYSLRLDGNDKPVNVQFIDTPGLNTQNINKIGGNKLMFDIIKSKVQEIDILLFVIPIDIRADFKEGNLELISEALGQDIWNSTIFILSKSDRVINNGTFEFYHFINFKTKIVQNEILRYIGCENTLDLPFLPMYIQENVENEVDWTIKLWPEIQRILNKRKQKEI